MDLKNLVQFLKYYTFGKNYNNYLNDLLNILKSEDENEKEQENHNKNKQSGIKKDTYSTNSNKHNNNNDEFYSKNDKEDASYSLENILTKRDLMGILISLFKIFVILSYFFY